MSRPLVKAAFRPRRAKDISRAVARAIRVAQSGRPGPAHVSLPFDLLNENGEPTVSWTVQDAFPKKLDAPSFNASSNEVAIENLELMASNLIINNPAI